MSWELFWTIVSVVLFIVTLIQGGMLRKVKKEGSEFAGASKIVFDTFFQSIKGGLTDVEKTDLLLKIESAKEEYTDVTDLVKEVADAWTNRGKIPSFTYREIPPRGEHADKGE